MQNVIWYSIEIRKIISITQTTAKKKDTKLTELILPRRLVSKDPEMQKEQD
jgi:hypothetical protein